MKNIPAPEIEEVMDIPHYLPSVTVIVPFEPKMSSKQELEQQLHSAYSNVRHQLSANYTSEKVSAVLERLNMVIQSLDYTTHKKSLCIFISPLIQKIIYMSISVEPCVIIDESFGVRNILRSKKLHKRFLLMALSGKGCQLYLGDNNKLIRMICNIPADTSVFKNDIAERVSNFSDPASRKEIVLHKFLHSVDNSLSLILESYPLPLIVMGAKRLLGHFKKISHHTGHAVAFIHGNFMESSEADILQRVQPYTEDWNRLKEADLFIQIDKAKSAGKLVGGIKSVYKAASSNNNRLLIVEQDYAFSADIISSGVISMHENSSPFFIKDAVDDVMEKVLRSGGDVEFVANGALKEFGHIVLIRHYTQANEHSYS